MFRKHLSPWSHAGAVLFLAVLATSPAFAQGKKGGGNGGDGGTTNPLPVQYEIKYLKMPNGALGGSDFYPNDLNNAGQVAGEYLSTGEWADGQWRAFLYHPDWDVSATDVGETVDLNSIVDNPLAPDWLIASATSINDRGDIVGVLIPAAATETGIRRGCIIDMNASPKPKLYAIPDQHLGTYTSALQINESGDVLGQATINGTVHWYLFNPGWYAGSTAAWYEGTSPSSPYVSRLLSDVLYDADGTPVGPQIVGNVPGSNVANSVFQIMPWQDRVEYLPFEGAVYDMSSGGAFCGRTQIEVPAGKRKTVWQDIPFRYDPVDGLVLLPSDGDTAHAINDNRDVLVLDFTSRNSLELHHYNYNHGPVKIDTLVTGTTADVEFWLAATGIGGLRMNDRLPLEAAQDLTSNHLGQITGYLTTAEMVVFLLTPKSTL